MVRHYRDLVGWRKAMDLAVAVYAVTGMLPSSERFGLVSQLQRASVSVPSNIAEGHERKSAREYRRFLAIASASLAELETQLHLCCRVGHLKEREVQSALDLASEVSRIIRGIDSGIRKRTPS